MSEPIPPGFELETPSSQEASQQTPSEQTTNVAPIPPGFEPEGKNQFEGAGETAKSFIRGAASSILPFGIAEAAEHRYLETPKEEIAGSAEAHPVAHGAGQLAGLLPPYSGEAKLMEMAGATALAKSGLTGASYGARVGSSIVKNAAEMAVFQGSDEVAKRVMQDDPGSAESAIANVGLASVIGGLTGGVLTGAVSPLWKATVGNKLESFLSSLTGKMGGIESASSKASDLAAQAGIEIPEELKAKIDGDPRAENIFSRLNQTDTTRVGRKLQESAQNFYNDLGSKMVENLGHSPDYAASLPELDKYGRGSKISETLSDELKNKIDPIINEYERTVEKFKNSPLSQETINSAADQIAQKAMEEGWNKAANKDNQTLMNNVLKELPNQENAADVKNFITNLRESNPYNSPTYGAARSIAKILEEAQGKAITEGIAAKGGLTGEAEKELENYQALKGKYANLMGTLDNLNEHLHVGKYSGPKSFLSALKDLGGTNAEGILNRLNGSNKAAVLDILAKDAPRTLEHIRQFHIDKLLDSAGGEKLTPNKFIKEFGKLSPQIKSLISGPEQQAKIEALGQLATRLNDSTHNWSNTARTADKLAHGNPTPLTLLAALTGHGADAILAHFGKLGFNEGADAVRLGMLKFLGSNQPIKSEGMKSMISFLHHAYKGEATLAKATAGVLKPGSQVLASNLLPDSKKREKLDKAVKMASQDPDSFMHKQTTGDLGHYMPNQQTAVAQASANAVQYLHNLKPQPQRNSPLDREVPPSPIQMARYNRALDIAIQPAIVMQHIKDGTIQISDLQDLKAMYPNYYPQAAQQLTKQVVSAHSEESLIPYKTKVGISLFLGQPMDSSMNPQSIIAAQPKPQQQPQQNQSAKKPAKSGEKSKIGNKTNNMYKTADQAAEGDRAGRD
jgi:hypothetical protein